MAVPVVGRGGSVVVALEVRVRKVRTELEQVQRMLVLAARSLSRELTSDAAAAWFAPAGSGAQAS
jgi:DNA-binding IclR family transcriptional regulator